MAHLEMTEGLVGFPQSRSEKLEILWEEYRAALLVQRRVKTIEIMAEVERARRAFQEEFDSSPFASVATSVATEMVQK